MQDKNDQSKFFLFLSVILLIIHKEHVLVQFNHIQHLTTTHYVKVAHTNKINMTKNVLDKSKNQKNALKKFTNCSLSFMIFEKGRLTQNKHSAFTRIIPVIFSKSKGSSTRLFFLQNSSSEERILQMCQEIWTGICQHLKPDGNRILFYSSLIIKRKDAIRLAETIVATRPSISPAIFCAQSVQNGKAMNGPAGNRNKCSFLKI